MQPPVKTPGASDMRPAKRKRGDNVSTQRVTRPRLSHNITSEPKPSASIATKNKVGEDNVGTDIVPLDASDEPFTSAPPVRKTNGKQKPAEDYVMQEAAPQASPSTAKQDLPDAKPAVSTVEGKSRRAVSKPKPASKVTAKQPPQATACSSKTSASSSKASATVKKEAKGPRQPAGACKTCRARHQKCDRTHPTCGRCTKFGIVCEYHLAADSAAPSTGASTAKSRKKQTLLPTKKHENNADREQDLRERSVTIGPEASRQQSPVRRSKPALPSKKPAIATPTAASSRTTRAKKTQNSEASPAKQKQK